MCSKVVWYFLKVSEYCTIKIVTDRNVILNYSATKIKMEFTLAGHMHFGLFRSFGIPIVLWSCNTASNINWSPKPLSPFGWLWGYTWYMLWVLTCQTEIVNWSLLYMNILLTLLFMHLCYYKWTTMLHWTLWISGDFMIGKRISVGEYRIYWLCRVHR